MWKTFGREFGEQEWVKCSVKGKGGEKKIGVDGSLGGLDID